MHPKAPPLPTGKNNENPQGVSFFRLVAEDYKVQGSEFFNQGFWALFWNRFGNARMDIKYRLFRFPFTIIYRIMTKFCQIFCGIKLDYTVKVGRRLRIEHFGGIIIGARSIGDDVVIRQNTTIGIRSKSDRNAKPRIGSNVNIGAGAVIVGDIVIGDGANIGANCVVSSDVPPHSLVRMPKPDIFPRD